MLQRLSSMFHRLLRGIGTGVIVVLTPFAFCVEMVGKAWWRIEDWWRGTSQEFKNKVDSRAFLVIVLVFTAALLAVAASGCATTPLAEKGKLEELKQPVTISGLIQVGQMGTECRTSSEEDEVRRIIREFIAAKGALVPDTVKLRLLSGSSLCGPAQGVTDPIGTPDYGAYSMARAEASLYWKGGIGKNELVRAEQAFNLLRINPIRPSFKMAIHPLK